MILVINNNQSKHSEKFKLFYHTSDAIKYANELGFSKYSFIGLSESDLVPGMLHSVNAGTDCNLEVIKIEPQSSSNNKFERYDYLGFDGC